MGTYLLRFRRGKTLQTLRIPDRIEMGMASDAMQKEGWKIYGWSFIPSGRKSLIPIG